MQARMAETDGPSPLLETRALAKKYGGTTVLHDVSFTLGAGEILALVGENGAGKSTLIKILSGAIEAEPGGEVRINGKPVSLHTPQDAERNQIVTVYQEFSLFPDLSITENLFFSELPARGPIISWGKLHREAEKLLRELEVHLPVRQRVSSLSVADRQMIEIAKAIHRRARIMILDEPTAVLGGKDVDRLLALVKQLKARGVAVIFVSHRLNEVFGLADTYLVLRDGAQVAAGPITETSPEDLVRKMVGRHIVHIDRVGNSEPEKKELLRVEGLSRQGVLESISFSVHSGEVVGIAGLRGAGRTELVRAIFGADPIDSGSIYIAGEKARVAAPHRAIARGLGLVPEDRSTQGLFKNLSVVQNIFMAANGRGLIDRRRERREALRHVESLNIRLPGLSVLVGSLSGGNQQKVVLAKWLQAGTRVLFLDEPTRGIDVGSKAQIYDLVHDLRLKGFGIVLISSELPEVIENSNRVLVMHRGVIVAELDRTQATEEAIISHAVGAVS
jgi:ABC-type sugar transport system ATPase subunit